jgi:hypothetical protein
MPAPVEGGVPGGTNADFGQAPGYNQTLGRELAVPGTDARPRTERLDQLRSVLVAAGQAIPGAVMTEARIQNLAQQRRQERIAESRRLAASVRQRQDEELQGEERQYRTNLEGRLQGVERSQFNILRDARSTNSEWVMNQAVLQQENAGSQEEKDAWNGFIIRYQQNAREDSKQEGERIARESNRRLADDVDFAAKTAQNAVDVFAQDISGDPELERQLIGDGRGIADRVYDYAYQAAIASAPELFNLTKSDPQYAAKKRAGDELLLELESRALNGIVRPLVAKAGKNQERSSEVAGWNLIEAQQLSYGEGRQDAETFHDNVGDIIRTKFAHLDPGQQDELRQKMYTQQFTRLVSMLDSEDPANALDRMEGLLSVADLSDSEKEVIRENIISDKFPQAVANRLGQQFASAENELNTVPVGSSGRSDPRKAALDMLRNPNGEVGGPSRYMDIGAQMLDKLGIKPGQPLTPLQANLQMAVLSQVDKAEQAAISLQKQVDRKVDAGITLRQGGALSSEDANKAWSGGWSMSAFSGNITPDDAAYQTLAQEYQQAYGEPIPWDGTSPLVLNEKTAKIGTMLAQEDARAWRGNTATAIPAQVGQRVTENLQSGNPAQVKWSLDFYHELGPAGQERLSKTLGTGPEAVWTNAVLIEGQRLLYNPRPTEQGRDIATVSNQIRSITETMANTANNRALLDAAVRWEREPKYNTDAAKALESALSASPSEGGFGADDAEGATSEDRIMDVIGQDRENLAGLYQRAYIIQALNPGTTIDTAMSTVVAEMRSQGYTVADSERGKVVIKDPFSHSAYEPKRDMQVLNNISLYANFPVERKYNFGMRNLMSQRTQENALKQYATAIGASDEDVAFAMERGNRKDWLLYSALKREAQAKGLEGLPTPESWDWRTAPMSGPDWNEEMQMSDGGIPMILEIPGFPPMNQMYHNGRVIHSFSATRLTEAEGGPAQPNRVVDSYLTSPARSSAIPVKPDSSKIVGELLELSGREKHARRIKTDPALLGRLE